MGRGSSLRAQLLAPVMAVLAVLSGACGQLTVSTPPNPCPDQPGLQGEELTKCLAVRTTPIPLVSERERDADAGGQLQGPALAIAGRPLRHAVVLDYSASMHSATCNADKYFWQLPEFGALLADGLLGAVAPKDPVYPLVFNRDVVLLGSDGSSRKYDSQAGAFGSEPLPDPVLGPAEALRRLTASGTGTLPADPARAGFGNPGETHLDAVLDALAALFELSPDRDGIAWIVTDNIIEHGQGREMRFNQEFYRRLETEPHWQVVYAWPLHQAPWLCDKTLMVYGFYYSGRQRLNENQYDQLTRGDGARINQPDQARTFAEFAHTGFASGGKPFKLKTAGMDIVRLSFEGVVQCPDAQVNQQRVCTAQIKVENLLYHRQIDSMRLVLSNGRCDARSESGGELVPTAVPLCAGLINQEIRFEQPLQVDQPRVLPVKLLVPPVRTERHTLADLWRDAQYERFLMVGSMQVEIRDLKTSMVIPAENLGEVYGVQDLPDTFRNSSVDQLQTEICLTMRVNNPSYLVSLGLIVLLALGALGFGVGGWLVKPTFRRVMVDGIERGRIRLTRLTWRRVLVDGRAVARARLKLNGQPLVSGLGGITVRRSGAGWLCQDPNGLDFQLQLSPTVRVPSSSRRNDDF